MDYRYMAPLHAGIDLLAPPITSSGVERLRYGVIVLNIAGRIIKSNTEMIFDNWLLTDFKSTFVVQKSSHKTVSNTLQYFFLRLHGPFLVR